MPITSGIYYHLYEGGAASNRPPIVLIHGAGGNHLYWPAEIRRLPGYAVYALDLPGHGKSSGRGRQSIDAYAQAVAEWLDTVNLPQAIFIGHSMGGAIVQTLALEYPDRVQALALIGSGSRLAVSPAFLEGAASETTFHSTIERIASLSFGPEADPRLVELAAARMSEVRPSVLHGDFVACDNFDITQRITEIQQPALLLCGHQDRMTPARLSQFLASSLPNACLQIIPEAGHMLMLEKPALVAAAITEFLAGLPA